MRAFYIKKVQPYIKPYLLKYKISYVEDLDPEDFVNIKPHQKVNRQILFIVAMIVWILETIYDLIFPADKTKQPKKKKKPVQNNPSAAQSTGRKHLSQEPQIVGKVVVPPNFKNDVKDGRKSVTSQQHPAE